MSALQTINSVNPLCLSCKFRLGKLCTKTKTGIAHVKECPEGIWESGRPKKVAPVSIVIPCHNYGKFLTECVESVFNQTLHPEEVVIVNDSSTDNTDEVVSALQQKYPSLRYVVCGYRNVFLTRRAGFQATSAKYIMFLDADDTLHRTYLAKCLALFSDERVGIVTTYMQEFGDNNRIIAHRLSSIDSQNYIHAGSMIRRNAMEVAEIFHKPVPNLQSHADWYMFRELVRRGWVVGQVQEPVYNYRIHGESMMALRVGLPNQYYHEANLDKEPITLVLPLSGRNKYWPHLKAWASRQSRITDILVIDTSSDVNFRDRVKAWMLTRPFVSMQYVSMPPSNGLADADRASPDKIAYRAVQSIMPKIYSHLRRVMTEYMLIVEDDVLPPENTIEPLLHHMRPDVAAVSGLMESRYGHGLAICHNLKQLTYPLTDMKGVMEVGGTGFGCLLLRKSALVSAPPLGNDGRTKNYDIEFARQCRELKWRWLIDCSVVCRHGEKPPPEL